MKGRSKKGGHARFHAKKGKRSREGVRFRPLGEGELSSDTDSDEDDKVPARPWLKPRTSMSSTTPTLVGDAADKTGKDVDEIDYEKEIKKLGQLKSKRVTAGLADGEVPDYSDYEEDVTTPTSKRLPASKEDKWSPGFMKKHHRPGQGPSSNGSQTTAVDPPTPGSPPIGAVPATPSLIKALDRIAVAQKDAFGNPTSGLPKLPEEGRGGAGWDDFWKDVRAKTGKDS